MSRVSRNTVAAGDGRDHHAAIGQTERRADRVLTVPSEWFAEDANVKAVRLTRPASPIFGDEVFAFVDLAHRDAQGLENRVVMARTPRGYEPMMLRRVGKIFLLAALGDSAHQELNPLAHDGDWSILGEVIHWVGNTPCAKKAGREEGARNVIF